MNNILELDHLIGFSGKNLKMCYYHPRDTQKIVYAVAGLVVIENVNDKHDQKFLRGHNMPITALELSQQGNLIVSGQQGSKQTKTREAPVILWDYRTLKPIQTLNGIREGVTHLSLSHDEHFLAATGANNTFTIWNLRDFTVVHNKVLEHPISAIQWGSTRKSQTRYDTYVLISIYGPTIIINTLDFNVGSMQYSLKSTQCQLPNSGLIRNYTQVIVEGDYIFAGTTAGEVCIYSISNQIFKAAIPLGNNGLLSLALFQDTLFVGTGDGKLRKLKGRETRWGLESELQLDGAITSLSLQNGFQELLVGTSSNNIYRVLTSTVNATLQTEGHQSSVVGVSFPLDKNDFFATVEYNGLCAVWDNNELNIITRCIPGSMNKVFATAVTITDDNNIVCGYTDGFIRAFRITNKPYSPVIWEIVNAHKGQITAIFVNHNYVLSGGQDGIVRVWSRVNKQLIQQISMHTKDVVSVFPDIQKENIIHSASIDKSVNTFDLKTDKKVIFHQAKNGQILHMSQRKDHELELVTCGMNIPILFWDCDVQEPVESINCPDKLNCIEVSPSGKYMALGNDFGEVIIVDINSKRNMGKYIGHSDAVSKLKWTPDEKQIVSTSYDGTICIWNFFK